MKTDNYLSLCLDQAAKSPLHYRHGSIIVRGGKIIGQGFNDYRPGVGLANDPCCCLIMLRDMY